MRHATVSVALVLLFGMTVAACATIASGTTQAITVSCNVEGADLYLDGEQIGTTPFTGPVPKNKGTLRVEAEGYQTETLSLSKTIDPLFFGNIILGGTLGSITDFASGAAYQYAPASYQVEMQADEQDEAAYRQQLATRKFAMIYADEISRDLAQGGGEHLSALLKIMTQYGTAEVDSSDISEAMQASRGNVVRFGNEVVGFL